MTFIHLINSMTPRSRDKENNRTDKRNVSLDSR